MPVSTTPYSKLNPYYAQFPETRVIDPDYENGFIANNGIRISHEKNMLCPNVVGRLETGEHDPNCELCDNGFIYYDKIQIFALFQNNKLEEYYRINGLWESDAAMISTPSKLDDNVTDFIAHRFDRIVLLDYLVRLSERIERNTVSDTDLLKYEAHSIERVATATTTYVAGTDYEIDVNGSLKWIGTSPADEEIFSVSYYYQPVFLVEALIHEGRYTLDGYQKAAKHAVRLPQLLLIKRDYLFEKRDSVTTDKLKEPIRYL